MNVCIGGVVGFAAVMAFLLCMCRAAAWADEAREDALRK